MSRWVVHAATELTARHALTSYRGRPEQPHTHLWRVEIRVRCKSLNREGFAIDFQAVKALLDEAVGPFAGADLNGHPALGGASPTAERLAEVIAGELGSRIAALGARLAGVSVWEGPDNRVDLELDA